MLKLTRTMRKGSSRDFDIAGGDLAFVSGKGGQDFGLLTLRNFEEIQGPSELRCDLIKFCWRDPEVPVGLLKAERRRAGLGGRELERLTRNVADPQRPHKLETRQPLQILGIPAAAGFWTSDRRSGFSRLRR